MSAGELVRIVKLDSIPATITIEASEEECAALAQRFELTAVRSLHAVLTFDQHGNQVEARGRLTAAFDQLCAVADKPFANTLDEAISLRFVPALTTHAEDEDIEFAQDEPDEIEYEGAALDIGEAVAQSFGLALDPYAEGPDAEGARREAGLSDEASPTGPFAALAALKKP